MARADHTRTNAERPLTAGQVEALQLMLNGPLTLGGRRDQHPSLWTWRTPSGRTVPARTVGGLMLRRLVRRTPDDKRELTANGRRLADQLAAPLAA